MAPTGVCVGDCRVATTVTWLETVRRRATAAAVDVFLCYFVARLRPSCHSVTTATATATATTTAIAIAAVAAVAAATECERRHCRQILLLYSSRYCTV